MKSLLYKKVFTSMIFLGLFSVLFIFHQIAFAQSLQTLIPSIHSTSEGGHWNSASTWIENRISNENDIVEINGEVTYNSHGMLTLLDNMNLS